MTTSEKSSFVPATLIEIKNDKTFNLKLVDMLIERHGIYSLVVGYNLSLDFLDFITIFDLRDYQFYKYNLSEIFEYDENSLENYLKFSINEMINYSNFITNRYPNPTEGLRYETFIDFLNGNYHYK